jgi:hypothetical protein
MPIKLEITYHDNSTRTVTFDEVSSNGWMPRNDYNTSRKSFKWVTPLNEFAMKDLYISLVKFRLLPYFNTNPILWAISVSTCPEELRPYLILPDEQLTYKGIN